MADWIVDVDRVDALGGNRLRRGYSSVKVVAGSRACQRAYVLTEARLQSREQTGDHMQFLIPLSLAFVVASCGSSPPPTFKFVGSSAAPAAEGGVVVRTGPNGNSQLTVTVHHLAPPERLQAGATAYVVWVTPLTADGSPQSVGALKLDAELNGTLETVTPLSEFRLTIGVEADPLTQTPTSVPVITTTVTR